MFEEKPVGPSQGKTTVFIYSSTSGERQERRDQTTYERVSFLNVFFFLCGCLKFWKLG